MKTRVGWSPVIDGYFLNDTFSNEALAGNIPDIPYMFGFTSNDLSDMTKAINDFCALRAEQSDKPAYAYLFQRQLPGDDSGAFHSADLWYVFHSMEHSWRPFTEGDKALSNQIVDYWTNFAKYGDPNGEEGGAWEPYTLENPGFMLLDANEEQADVKMSENPVFAGNSFRR